MTFYEAALRVLESEGRPLHFLEITQKSVAQNLLSHVGKTPEQTMLSRLAAMARRARDRRVCVTAKDTFALIEWGLPEDVEALSQTGIPEPNPEEDLPPLRPVERHPDPRSENARAAGRGTERKGRRDEDEDRGRRRKKFPPIAEVVFEILSESTGPLRPEDIAARAREKELASDELSAERMLTALLEDNQRRIDAGRRPQFALDKSTGQLSLERAGAPVEAPPVELIAAFAEALGIPLEGGRPVLPRAAAAAAVAPVSDGTLEAALAAAKTAVKEYRRAMAKQLRRRLAELDGGVLEKAVVKMLHGHGFRELKVAKRSKDGPLLTARRRDGSVELRYAVRILKGGGQVDRKEVKELRRDLQHYAAQIGLLCAPGEVRSEGRTEGQQTQGGLVLLWCGDALADKFLDTGSGVRVTTIELYDVDEQFFAQAKLDADEATRRREERHREKEQREGPAPRVREEPRADAQAAEQGDTPSGEQAAEAPPAPRPPPPQRPPEREAANGDREDEDDDDEGEDEHLEAASAFVAGAASPNGEGAAAPGERKRRRRRRRGRRGRGPRTEGAEGAAPAGAAGEAGAGSESAGSPPAGASSAGAPLNGGGSHEGRGSHEGGGSHEAGDSHVGRGSHEGRGSDEGGGSREGGGSHEGGSHEGGSHEGGGSREGSGSREGGSDESAGGEAAAPRPPASSGSSEGSPA